MMTANGGRGITQQQISDICIERGIASAYRSVGAILHDQYDNADIQQVFCDLTGTQRHEMFPGSAAWRREQWEKEKQSLSGAS